MKLTPEFVADELGRTPAALLTAISNHENAVRNRDISAREFQNRRDEITLAHRIDIKLLGSTEAIRDAEIRSQAADQWERACHYESSLSDHRDARDRAQVEFDTARYYLRVLECTAAFTVAGSDAPLPPAARPSVLEVAQAGKGHIGPCHCCEKPAPSLRDTLELFRDAIKEKGVIIERDACTTVADALIRDDTSAPWPADILGQFSWLSANRHMSNAKTLVRIGVLYRVGDSDTLAPNKLPYLAVVNDAYYRLSMHEEGSDRA